LTNSSSGSGASTEEVQNYFLRLAQEKGFLETVFNAIQEGIIVTDSNGRITYLNEAACALFGLEAADAIGNRLEERIRGLDWESLTESGGPVSHDMEIFYPQNRFINFYIVPLVIDTASLQPELPIPPRVQPRSMTATRRDRQCPPHRARLGTS